MCILVEDVPLCFNSPNKINPLLRLKNTTVLYNCWYFVMATCFGLSLDHLQAGVINLLKPTGYVMHRQFNIQQLYALPTLYLCVLYLSENKQRLVPLTA